MSPALELCISSMKSNGCPNTGDKMQVIHRAPLRMLCHTHVCLRIPEGICMHSFQKIPKPCILRVKQMKTVPWEHCFLESIPASGLPKGAGEKLSVGTAWAEKLEHRKASVEDKET